MFFYKPYNQANLICRLLWCQHLRHSVIERVSLAVKQSYSVCLTWALSSHSATMSGPRDMLLPTMPSGALLLHLTGYVLLLFYDFRFEVINTKIIYFTVIVWEWLWKKSEYFYIEFFNNIVFRYNGNQTTNHTLLYERTFLSMTHGLLVLAGTKYHT